MVSATILYHEGCGFDFMPVSFYVEFTRPLHVPQLPSIVTHRIWCISECE